MENKKYGCYVMAEAIQAVMTMANFSGHIKQDGATRQFAVSSVDGDEDRALLRFTFAGQSYQAEITIDGQQ